MWLLLRGDGNRYWREETAVEQGRRPRWGWSASCCHLDRQTRLNMGSVGQESQGYEGRAFASAEAWSYAQGWASTWAPEKQEEGLEDTVVGVASSKGGVHGIRQHQDRDGRDICLPKRDEVSWEEYQCLDCEYDHDRVDR